MKKWGIACLLVLLMLCAAFGATAEEAADITDLCKLKSSYTKFKLTQMTDGKYTTYVKTSAVKNPFVAITAPRDQLIGGVYVCFGKLPEIWEVQVSEDGKNWTAAKEGPAYLHAWVPLDTPSRYVRIMARTEKNYVLYINELFVLSAGDKPDWVQDWEPTPEKADIMFIATHPDDELIFFGGAVPTYAVERQLDVVTAYFTYSNGTRSSELLNGLWHMGVRHYPVMGTFADGKAKNMKEAYKRIGGREKVNAWFVELYRRFRPEVVVTQDIDGEYGHTQHKIVSQAAIDAVAPAAQAAEFPQSAEQYGTWEIRKLYLHLWPERQLVMDWDIPLESMGGRTGMELADQAFNQFHRTQASLGQAVLTLGMEYDNRIFGLVHTTVGEDVMKNDFLENISLVEEE